MPLQNPDLWQNPLGYQADVNPIPDANVAGSNQASFAQIFPLLTQLPLSAGGLPPDRKDFNALFKLIGDNVYFLQRGGVYLWEPDVTYPQNAVIMRGGVLYQSLQDNNTGNEPGSPDNEAWQVFLDSTEGAASNANLMVIARILDKVNGTTLISGDESQEQLTPKLNQLLGSIAQMAKLSQPNSWEAQQHFNQGFVSSGAQLEGITTVTTLQGQAGGSADLTAMNRVLVPTPQPNSPDNCPVTIGYLNSVDTGGDNNVLAPVPVSPLTGATKVAVMTTFTAGIYRNNFTAADDPRQYRQFQVKQHDAGSWDDPLLNIEQNADSITLTYEQRLNGESQYDWRCRDVSSWGQIGAWSLTQTFETDVNAGILTPTLTVTGAPDNVPEDPTLVASAFTTVSGTDTHVATDWRIERVVDNMLIWESANDAVNLSSIQVPRERLAESTQYRFMVRYKGENFGYSNWAQVVGTTRAKFVQVITPTVTVTGAPLDVPENPTISGSAFSVTSGYTDTHESTDYQILDGTTNDIIWNAYNQTGANLTSIQVPNDVLQEAHSYVIQMRYKGHTYGYGAWGSTSVTTKTQFVSVQPPQVTVTGAPSSVPETPTISGSAFSVTTGFTDTHECTDYRIIDISNSYQVWSASNQTGDQLTSIQVPKDILAEGKNYRFEMRYKGAKYGYSEWASIEGTTMTKFTYIATPNLNVTGAPNAVPECPVLSGGAFTVVSTAGETDTHASTDWKIVKASNNTEVWSSIGDTVNLTSITVPSGKLETSTSYIISVVYNGTALPPSSAATATVTTSATFNPINTPLLTVEHDAKGVYEAPILRGGDYIQNQGESNRHSATDWRITSADGTETIWESASNQVYKTYIQVPDGYLQPNTDYRFMCRYQGSASGWSEWAQVTAKTQETFYDTEDIEILSANIDRSGVNSIFDFSLSDVATRPYCTPPVALRLKIYNQTKQNYITEQTVILNTPNHYVINDSNSVEWANGDQIEYQVFYKSNTADDDTGAVSATSTKIATVNAPVTVFYDNLDFNQTHVLLEEPTLKISFNFYQTSWSVESVDYVLRDASDTQTLWQSLNDTSINTKDIDYEFNWLTDYVLKIKAHARNTDQSTADSQEMVMHITTAPGAYGTIGIPGQIGFGVGVYPGDDLSALNLTPMPGCDIVGSENYGNYQHTNGSVFCFVPAFYYRIGNSQAPNYATYGANAVEIANFNVFPDETTANAAGFKLHRAFINGGQVKSGFFCAKYLASKGTNGSSSVPLYVKNGKTISLTSGTYGSNTCGGAGNSWDAITLSKNLGSQYNCETFAIAGAIAILALAHAQNSTGTAACAWYDAAGTMNFPKGNNSNLHDVNDTSIAFTANGDYNGKAQTGSGVPFEKTTHNGQVCGIADVNGNMYQCVIGFSYINGYKVFSDNVDISTITQSNLLTESNYIAAPSNLGSNRWGNGANSCFWSGMTGAERAMDGFWCPSTGVSSSGTNQFGQDWCGLGSNSLFVVAGSWDDASGAGVFYRDIYNSWGNGYSFYGWRAVAYGGL